MGEFDPSVNYGVCGGGRGVLFHITASDYLLRCFTGWYLWSGCFWCYNFYGWFRLGIDLYIPHYVYQVKPHLFPRFSSAWAVVITYRNPFFGLFNWIDLLSTAKLRQVINYCKGFLNLSNLIWFLLSLQWILVYCK